MSEGFSLLDRHFADFLAGRSGLAGADRERFFELAARVSAALEDGHSCLPLTGEEEALLRTSPLVSDGGRTPLVVHNRRLYLHRYYHYETRLAGRIKAMAALTLDPGRGDELLDGYFGIGREAFDGQRRAAMMALRKVLTIICGGPGTGKTTTVVKILAILLQAAEGRLPAIALAAPTGKAAMRLSESVGGSVQRLALPEGIAEAMPSGASTLHRLLGVLRNSPRFRHNRENPIPFDIVVVDEASMVDLALMSKLVDALKPGARLLLLGDRDQLASVESGAVLGDLIRSLPDNTVTLEKTYRFDENIKKLATAINAADGDSAWSLLQDPSAENTSLLGTDFFDALIEPYVRFLKASQQLEGESGKGKESEKLEIESRRGEGHSFQLPTANFQLLFSRFNSFRVLCAVHYGNRGVEAVNRRIELALARRGYLSRNEVWYPGRPVLVTRNDYGLELFNGDIGICLKDTRSGDLKVWFERPDGGLKSYPPHRLPRCETAFAMTIHKSQGSEFDEVAVILPEEDNPILSRELLYTAVTRAKKAVRLASDKDILRLSVSRNTVRHSGLAEFLV